jgi:chemotaxis signal transduction protein
MRVFLSAFSGFTLAVPMDAVGAMVLYNQKMEKTIQYDQGKRSTYVSLPMLFNLPNETVHHGIVLREWNDKENKAVLVTPEVKRDIEIPDEQFYPIQKSLGALRFSEVFSGIHFSGNPILLLNIERLAQSIMNETHIE